MIKTLFVLFWCR